MLPLGVLLPVGGPLHRRDRLLAVSTQPPHVPSEYLAQPAGRAVLWSRASSRSQTAALVEDALACVERLLDHRPRRTLHVVEYASNEEACRALDRRVAPTQMLAPLHTPELALIALHASSVHRRHLCHELAHVFSAERTGSVKRLGDDNRGMRLAEWVDEGFAENVAAAAAERPDIIETALMKSSRAALSDEQLMCAFRDLHSPDRDAAYAIATARVWRAVQAHDLRWVFANLPAISSRGT